MRRMGRHVLTASTRRRPRRANHNGDRGRRLWPGGTGAGSIYEYDYGDGWLHVIVVERYQSAREDEPEITCVAGERACPPEDVGGVYGYEDLLMILADPNHEEHERMRNWAGKDFEPEVFDANAVNRVLRRRLRN